MGSYKPTPTQLREAGGKGYKSGGSGGLGSPFKAAQQYGKDVVSNLKTNLYNSGLSLQYVPGTQNNARLGDLYPGRGGASGRGGGGGYDPYAAQRAAEEARKQAMREAIQAQYGGAIDYLGNQNNQSASALGNYYNEAQGRINPIYANNQALTGQYSQQLADLAQNATRGVMSEGDMLARDLQGQGVQGQGLGDLRGVIGANVTDMLGARSAQDQYNTRLAQIMGLSQTDNSAMLSAILQGAQSNRENSYAQQLARLQAEQAQALAGLA